MPIYVYRCAEGHETEALVKSDRSDEPKGCPHLDSTNLTADGTYIINPTRPLYCSLPLERVMGLNAKSFPGADSWRK